MTRRSGSCIRICLVTFAIVSALCVSGPAIYWKFKKGFSFNKSSSSSIVCNPCVCDCPPPLSLLKLAPVMLRKSVGELARTTSLLPKIGVVDLCRLAQDRVKKGVEGLLMVPHLRSWVIGKKHLCALGDNSANESEPGSRIGLLFCLVIGFT
ncbi:hypothetical protein CTI12_AA039760 [Artemisia annua]|uniref:Uncharacterized protein n=1 Tax=Artemisia annua TaxID=35608 RepID=A0A2U1Q3Q6_ARTAN|nr:hypothetical protein CTI12_AA039760 [Artemisia annua]